MDEPFSILVICQGQEYSFEARLATVGYTHKFYVMINGMEVIYEPDEERNYRAILNHDQSDISEIITPYLLETIVHYIEASIKE